MQASSPRSFWATRIWVGQPCVAIAFCASCVAAHARDGLAPKPVAGRPTVTLVMPPERPGTRLRYDISAELWATGLLGVSRSPVEQRLGPFCPQADGFTSPLAYHNIRQFRLSDGRHALCFWDGEGWFSLVLTYKAPPPRGKGRTLSSRDDGSLLAMLCEKGRFRDLAMRASSPHGTLEAWLLRHASSTRATLDAPVERWKRFLSLTDKQRTQDKEAFRLTGQV